MFGGGPNELFVGIGFQAAEAVVDVGHTDAATETFTDCVEEAEEDHGVHSGTDGHDDLVPVVDEVMPADKIGKCFFEVAWFHPGSGSRLPASGFPRSIITSYSIHYTKLYDVFHAFLPLAGTPESE